MEAAEALLAGRLTSEALVAWAVERHGASEGQLGAFVAFDSEAALEDARLADQVRSRFGSLGPLHGIPVSIKDHFGVSGFPTFAGTRRELPEGFRQEGPVVRALRQELAVVTGKTIAVELAFGGIGTNPHWGTPKNPWDAVHHRVPGGSSAGAGVSLWQGTALVALGTDTAGSCRIPAAMTGTVGLKTTLGRWSTAGVVPLSSTLDTVGFLTSTVGDAAWVFEALDADLAKRGSLRGALRDGRSAGRPRPPASPRLGVVREQLWEDCSPGVAEALEAALSELSGAQMTVGEAALPETREAEDLLRSGSVVSAELDDFLERELPYLRDGLDPAVASRIKDGGEISAREYLARRARIRALAQAAQARFTGWDVLVCPTVPITPPVVSALEELAVYRRQNFLALRNTCVANFLGLCALSLPVGLDAAGMPVGLQLLAPAGAEVRLLEVGMALEAQLGTPEDRLGWPPGVPRGTRPW